MPLGDGGWAPLPRGWLEKHGERVADLLAAREDDGRLARHVAARPRGAVRRAGAPAAARARPPARRCSKASSACRRRRCPRISPPTLRAYQQRGRRLARVPARRRPRRRARRRHGPRQDAAGALRVRTGRGRWWCARPACSSTGRRSSRASGPASSVASTTGRRARSTRPPTHAHHLRAPAPRRRGAVGARLGHGRARRGAGDQEPRQPGRARRLRAAGGVPPGADRHAGREPARGAVEPAALHQPRPARRARATSRTAARARSPRAARAPRRRCASASARSCCAA